MRIPPNHTDQSRPSLITRRALLGTTAQGLGSAALASLFSRDGFAGQDVVESKPRAKRVIYIFQAGGPAQMELYDYKPELSRRHGEELPESLRADKRLTGFTAGQGTYPIVRPSSEFRQYGENGTWLSSRFPHLGQVVDELCFVRSMHTEAINHDPAVTHMMTGHQQPGRPSMGAWMSYGIGSENDDLPAFVVLLTPGLIQDASTPLSTRHWGAGFLPAEHQGVSFRAGRDPVLYLSNPQGIDRSSRRNMLDTLSQLNRLEFEQTADPEITARIAQYEMAFRMQQSVPELMDTSQEPEHVFELYGEQARIPGSYAANCLLARRLVEQGVRFVQIFDRDWDHHRNAPAHIKTKAETSDQPTAGLILDLKRRGLLDDTLVVCAGEFGRTVYCQGPLIDNYGRDHHGGCFTAWLAGGGVKPGFSFGETDDFSYEVVKNPVHVHDLQATILHCLGIDHEQLTYRFQSREFRLTDVGGNVVHELLT